MSAGTWPDVERAVAGWLDATVDATVVTELRSGWAPPLVLVERTPGGATGSALDKTPLIDISVYASSRIELWPLVQEVETAMADLAGNGPVMVDDVDPRTEFGVVPYSNDAIRRAIGSYALTVRPE
jgi:hypothetical protein